MKTAPISRAFNILVLIPYIAIDILYNIATNRGKYFIKSGLHVVFWDKML